MSDQLLGANGCGMMRRQIPLHLMHQRSSGRVAATERGRRLLMLLLLLLPGLPFRML
jgi:hypothetical protein